MTAIFTFHTGKAVVQIAAVEVTVNDILQIGPPEPVLPGEILVIDPDKGFKIILYTAVIIGQLGIPRAIGSDRKGHDLSPWRISCRHKVERPFYLSRRIWAVVISIRKLVLLQNSADCLVQEANKYP
jgi:hypothetical protein